MENRRGSSSMELVMCLTRDAASCSSGGFKATAGCSNHCGMITSSWSAAWCSRKPITSVARKLDRAIPKRRLTGSVPADSGAKPRSAGTKTTEVKRLVRQFCRSDIVPDGQCPNSRMFAWLVLKAHSV